MKDPMNESRSSWSGCEDAPLNEPNLTALLHNRIPMICLPEFASFEECDALRKVAFETGFDYDRSVSPPIGRIGVALYSYREASKPSYFAAAEAARGKQSQIFSKSFDPITRLRDRLGEVCNDGAALAVDPGYGPFFAGLIRLIHLEAGLHADFVQIDAPDSAIADVVYQLAWNLYLTQPEAGGDCLVYDRLWEPDCESEKAEGSALYYRKQVVEDCTKAIIRPRKGDLVMFNCRNLHEIEPCSGERMAITSFIGCRPNGSLVMWS